MTSPLSRLALAAAGLVACCFALLAPGDVDSAQERAAPPPLRFDLIPKEHRGKKGRYLPTRGKVSIPDVPRNEVICFCLYTTHRGVLKLNVQLYPLKDDESRKVTLHIDRGDGHKRVTEREVDRVGWSTVFRVEKWDDTKPAKYRVTHPGGASYQGVIRTNPVAKDEIVVGNLSCNSSTDRNMKPDLVANLKALDPDLLFFAGGQSYDHKEHLAAWLLGRQFGEVIKDRPTVTIPDDHDVGHPNLWGAGGKKSNRPDGADGGYFMPVEYVNMVQRQQTGHLPDPFDPAPVARGITVYYTSLNVGGIDFAILEDRQWKPGPFGLVKINGPRPDHVTDPKLDPRTLDVPEATLLGGRQLKFLRHWAGDWDGAVMKCVLSQSPFADAAHLHGGKKDRLVADLDCNGWPQSGRDFHDGLGNKITVAAYANPTAENYQGTGFGLVRFRKKSREIVMECWPRFVDVTKPKATQYPGWPLSVTQEDNYARNALAWLPTVKASVDHPVVQVIDEATGEVVYTLRIQGREWRPRAFRVGPHTIRVGTGGGQWKERKGVEATFEKPDQVLNVML